MSRLVKHTGYGNAAGLLARRGLMTGGRGGGKGNYSSDEDSDTEEYRNVDTCTAEILLLFTAGK